VRDITTKFGTNAGIIWTALNEKGCLEKEDIIKVTKLSEKEFYSAIGWLARENKISREEPDCYKLEKTNLDSEIGSHAGRVWKIIEIWEDIDIDSIKKLSDLNDYQIQTALGWLAREDKLVTCDNNRFKLK
jgi:hypothetical protein